MISLGIRLTLTGGRAALASVVLTAVAVSVGTAILLFGLALSPALDVRYSHIAWRSTPSSAGLEIATADRGLIMSRTDARFEGRSLARMDVAALDASAPLPPGLSRIPAAGEAFVSPALAALIETTPSDELGDRFGTVVGTIRDAGLASPDELVAVVGDPPDVLRASGARVVTQLDTEPRLPPVSPLIQLLLAITLVGALTPVAVFVATATRLSAARRDQRLAAMRLVGATPRQVYLLAIGEALTSTLPGALLGVGLFFLVRPLVALVPLDGNTWFPDAIAVPILQAVGLLVIVQVVGAVSAILALRRISISPLGVSRRVTSRPLSPLRLVPVTASVVGFAVSLLLIPVVPNLVLWLIAGMFFGVIVGIAIAGPWITMLVGRAFGRLARGPGQLLAARRLTDDPRGSFGAIAGVVMAVFVASVFYSVAAFAGDTSARIDGGNLPAGTLDVSLPSQPGVSAPVTLASAIAGQPGVGSVGVIRAGQAATLDGAVVNAWVTDCAAIAVLVPGAACGPRTVYARGPEDVAGLKFSGPAAEPAPDGSVGSGADAPPVTMGDAASTTGFPATPPDGVDVVLTPDLLPDNAAAFAVTRLVVTTDTADATIERARTALERAFPTAKAWTTEEFRDSARGPLDELGRIVALGLVGTLLVAGCSLAIAVIGGIVERRRPLALLRLAGMPVRRLQAMAMLEAAVPLLVVTVLAAVIGIVVAQILLRFGTSGGTPPLPGLELLLVLTLGVGAALGVVGLTLPMIRRATELESTRFE